MITEKYVLTNYSSYRHQNPILNSSRLLNINEYYSEKWCVSTKKKKQKRYVKAECVNNLKETSGKKPK